MLCDAVREDEIFEAYMLYASLHGMCTNEKLAHERIASYRKNVPDSVLDEAILAFAEDRIVAPPDVVLASWGKSRVYSLYQTPQLEWRHRVCPSWFDNGCAFLGGGRDPALCHFWTEFPLTLSTNQSASELYVGARLRLLLTGNQVRVVHRNIGAIGELPRPLAQDFVEVDDDDLQTLSLIDDLDLSSLNKRCKLLVTRASGEISLAEIVTYAAQAFQAVRTKC